MAAESGAHVGEELLGGVVGEAAAGLVAFAAGLQHLAFEAFAAESFVFEGAVHAGEGGGDPGCGADAGADEGSEEDHEATARVCSHVQVHGRW